MPVIRRTVGPQETPADLADARNDLVRELLRPRDFGQPLIEEEEFPRTGLLMVTVIWDRWAGVSDRNRSSAILGAYETAKGVEYRNRIAVALGLTVAEAMWKAKPVVAGRVGGIEDQLEHGKSGLLVDDPRDLPAFGDAVVSLLTDGMKAKTIGRAARRRVVRFFITPCHLVTQGRLLTDLVST